jgi:hypothetical protein
MIRLVMQNNLISENDLGQIQQACKEAGAEVQEIRVVPFSEDIPEFTYNRKNLYYGSTTLMYNIHYQFRNPIGLFYNENFNMEAYLRHWDVFMFNYDVDIITVGDFLNNDTFYEQHHDKMFVRPNGDGKEFDGQVGTIQEICGMFERTIKYEGPLDRDTKILVGPAYNINKEWRLYIVNREIVTASRYRTNFKLSESNTDIPEEMIKFAKQMINKWRPHDNFAMDIASDHDGVYYVLECGCLNSVGFYACDINKLFKSMVKWMEKQ